MSNSLAHISAAKDGAEQRSSTRKIGRERIERDGCFEEFQMIINGNLNQKYYS